mmetsp:Transcript_131176/g.185045  ORF Transcript_131176/g.185045 Transcript_131176/m.185045 type:complete len:81 (-) Transcript_131176:263-505(-)
MWIFGNFWSFCFLSFLSLVPWVSAFGATPQTTGETETCDASATGTCEMTPEAVRLRSLVQKTTSTHRKVVMELAEDDDDP